MPQAIMLKKLKLNDSMKTYKAFTNTPQKMSFSYRGLECKSRSQEIPGVTGKFGLGEQNEAGQKLTQFCQENTLVTANSPLPAAQEKTLHMDITRWSKPK